MTYAPSRCVLIVQFLVGCSCFLGCSNSRDQGLRHQDWNDQCARARQLADSYGREGFFELLSLLHDQHPDVRRCTTDAIAARAQAEYLDALLDACSQIWDEHRWLLYKMLESYPDPRTLVFLADRLHQECVRTEEGEILDHREFFYITRSMQAIMEKLEVEACDEAAEDKETKKYDDLSGDADDDDEE